MNLLSNTACPPLLALLALAPGGRAPQASAEAGATEPVRRALLIGINAYVSDGVPDLSGCVNDVEAMRGLLAGRFGFAAEHTKVLTNEAATRAGILAAFETLVEETRSEDLVFVHYAGHGSQVADVDGDEEDKQDETLVPHDGRTSEVPDITDDELDALLDRLEARSAVIVLDCCHSGTGTRSSAVRARRVDPDKRSGLYTAARAASRGIVALPSERYVLMTGAADDESALDGPIEGRYHGAFSFALVRSLAAAAPEIAPRRLFEGVEREMRRLGEQWMIASMPEPQLEAPEGLLDAALLPSIVASSPVDVDPAGEASPRAEEEIPVFLRGWSSEPSAALAAELRARLPGFRSVGADEFALLHVELQGSACRVLGSDGTSLVASFPIGAEGPSVEKLVRVIERCLDTAALATLHNPSSRIQLELCVGTPRPRAATRIGQRGFKVVADNQVPVFRVRKGERNAQNSLQLSVRVDTDCYVTIVDIDAEGSMNLLFPNPHSGPSFHPGGLLRGGSWHSIPDSLAEPNSAGFWWDAAPPAGMDTIRVFASTDPGFAEELRDALASLETSPSHSTRRAGLDVLRRSLGPRGFKVVESATGTSSATPETPAPSGGEPADADWTASSLTLRIDE